jgi:threonine synthase
LNDATRVVSAQSHLECSRAGCDFAADYTSAQNLCEKCQSPLLARYDWSAARRTLTLDSIRDRINTMWRYAEVLPDAAPVSLGEGMTPLLHAKRFGNHADHSGIFIKDEGLNPTGSFKARGLSAAVSMAKALGRQAIALPTAGNAGGAAAAYAAKADLACVIAMPADTPKANVIEARAFGADVRLIDGLISDCGRFIGERAAAEGWFEVSTLKEPYRIEGKKTMGAELEALGLIGEERPRMIAVQADGCAPIVRAFEERADASAFWEGTATVASGLRVPKAIGDFIILANIYESRGQAVAVTDAELMRACRDLARLEGIFAAPEGGAGLAAVTKLLEQNRIAPDESVVVFNTGSGYKYLDAWSAALDD